MQQLQQNVLFEDHTYGRLQPLALSTPTYEIRCGMFNTRERLQLVTAGQGGLALCREILRPLHAAPDWSCEAGDPAERTLWLNGRLAPDADLVARLHSLRGEDWALTDEQGLLAAALNPSLSALLLASWQSWEAEAWAPVIWAPGAWELPAEIKALIRPELGAEFEAVDLGWIWDLVPATSRALAADLKLAVGSGPMERHPFGLITAEAAAWSRPGSLRLVDSDASPAQVHISGDGGLYLGSGGVEIAPGTHIDTSAGAVVLDSGVRVMAHAYLAGPLYIGRDSIVKPGAHIFGESSFGVGNRLAGEIGESTFGDFANKQHDGFIGHAVLGSWINLGAMTTCSDLKNNYGPVRVDLGAGLQDTGQRFVGLMLGDHAKTAIGSLFNTGTAVGFASNIFGGGMPPKFVPNFSWGGQNGAPTYDEARARQTGQVVLERRGCLWTAAHARLFTFLHARASG